MKKLNQLFRSARTHAAALGTSAMVLAGTAMAGGGTAVDTSAIEAEFDIYKVAAVGLTIAFAVVLWAKRGSNLVKP